MKWDEGLKSAAKNKNKALKLSIKMADKLKKEKTFSFDIEFQKLLSELVNPKNEEYVINQVTKFKKYIKSVEHSFERLKGGKPFDLIPQTTRRKDT